MELLLLASATLLLSLLLVRMFLVVSRQRLLDLPGDRSSHTRPTPTGGGLPAVAAWVVVGGFGVCLGAVQADAIWWAATGATIALAALGIADDARGLSARLRYGIHVLVATGVVCLVGPPASPASLPVAIRVVGAAVFLTALINMYNFMDGIDALVGGTGAITLSMLAVITASPLWWLPAAAYTGFLVFNIPPARIFMGDAGSTVMGALIGIAVLGGRLELHPLQLIVLTPLVGDATYTLFRRVLRGENIFRAHHSHLYQRLLRAGYRHGTISACYMATTLALGLVTLQPNVAPKVAALFLCALAVIGLEIHLLRRGVPFTRS
ncbi:MAG: glycosyltransferase family 4 protein [Kofleriaceae bacterium]|nr:glycosyltransferase family 4 protein [Kofleriaceae bacterium]